jgi:hypothetical protein
MFFQKHNLTIISNKVLTFSVMKTIT